eukprot:gnl/TRDRNA2_/TRDRNA2_177980_c2_seq16.p1 gnl/TRDRNA2_/TRDRNA2_177980_c2~~gnl/TRDRNA2_/TRDRNA2_177980_c2_seq16.p1  ORF type:complete len:211 (+),score=21.80 gnl/TRDRNA2_/TRDRNA2_177980_c2_seq16:2-634(+)
MAPSEDEESVCKSSSVSDTTTTDVVVWVDAFSEKLDVLRWSVGFTALAGGAAPSGVKLLEWVGDEQEEFECWVQSAVNSFSNSEEPPQARVILRPTHLKHSRVHVSVTATIRRPEPDLEDPDATSLECFPVQIVLSEITWGMDRSRRKSMKGRGTPSVRGVHSSMRAACAGDRGHDIVNSRSEAMPVPEDSSVRHLADGATDRCKMLLTL